MKIVTVVGARPQFIKAAAVSRAIAEHNAGAGGSTRLDEIIVHTGQHYDANMSRVFFDELRIPEPACNLEVGSDSHARQTATILERMEAVLTKHRPDGLLVYGDTNSTLAGALAAAKLGIPIAHVEAGLRSFNRTMPEEINRVLTDRISTLLFCPTLLSVENLAAEGMTDGVHQTGDVMYDSVLFNTRLADERSHVLDRLSLSPKSYVLATVHRAENTDDPARLDGIMSALAAIDLPIVFPMHPRTRNLLGERAASLGPGVRIIEPAAYLDMLMLERGARAILTDSGGMQKEAFFLGVPCVTLREETEWVELVDAGVNRLAGADRDRILATVRWAIDAEVRSDGEPLYGDGRAAHEIVRILAESLAGA